VAGITPSQTVGPFFDFGLAVPGAESVASEGTDGQRIAVEGTVRDGAGQPVPDALIEIWQANADGRYAHPADPRATPEDCAFRGFGRCATDGDGRFRFDTILPGRVPFPSDPPSLQAPHLAVGVLARGVLTRLVTRMYFEGQASNDEDAVLRLVPAGRRATLVARRVAPDRYEFDIVLQGDNETVFFDV
jgi:protocatechuate 3,4-dioxygenase alpha subunit